MGPALTLSSAHVNQVIFILNSLDFFCPIFLASIYVDKYLTGWQGAFCDKPQCGVCTNGECVRPNTCRCHDGWTGENCDICIPRTGCQHGSCEMPHTCVCQSSWQGLLCDEPICNKSCVHGQCMAVGGFGLINSDI